MRGKIMECSSLCDGMTSRLQHGGRVPGGRWCGSWARWCGAKLALGAPRAQSLHAAHAAHAAPSWIGSRSQGRTLITVMSGCGNVRPPAAPEPCCDSCFANKLDVLSAAHAAHPAQRESYSTQGQVGPASQHAGFRSTHNRESPADWLTVIAEASS